MQHLVFGVSETTEQHNDKSLLCAVVKATSSADVYLFSTWLFVSFGICFERCEAVALPLNRCRCTSGRPTADAALLGHLFGQLRFFILA